MAAIYVTLSLLTALFFILTRNIKVEIKKTDDLKIKINAIFFSLTLIQNKKNKKQKENAIDFPFVFSKVKAILEHSSLEIKKLYIPFFPIPKEPSDIPFIIYNKALNTALAAYLAGYAKSFSICENATSFINGEKNGAETIYHLILRSPLLYLLFTFFLVTRHIKKNEKRKSEYVTN